MNHKLVPLSHKLQSGDQVEILSSKAQHVQPSWINFCSSAKAKAKIQAILRRENREIQKKGEQILTDWMKKNDFELTTSNLDKLCEYHDMQKHDDLFLAIGERTILLGEKDIDKLNEKDKKSTSTSSWRKYVSFLGLDKKKKKDEDNTVEPVTVKEGFNKKKPCIINEEHIGKYFFRDCCHPIPGDDILGYIDNKNHIEIHKRNCPVASRLKTSYGNRILDAKWDMHRLMFFDATVEIKGIDRKGMIFDVAKVITDELDINIHRVTVTADEGIFDGSIDLRVHDRSDVKLIMDRIKKVDGIQEVMRIN